MIGKTVSHYRILEPLGEGGMGTVYLAEDTHLGRRVAIKFPSVNSDSHDYRARFLREARAVSELSHPGIATLFDYGETDEGRPFLVMELARGRPLTELMQKGELNLPRAVAIVTDVADSPCRSPCSRRGSPRHQAFKHNDRRSTGRLRCSISDSPSNSTRTTSRQFRTRSANTSFDRNSQWSRAGYAGISIAGTGDGRRG